MSTGEAVTQREASDMGFLETRVSTTTYTRRRGIEAWSKSGAVIVLIGTPSADRAELLRKLDLISISGETFELSPAEAREFGERLIRLASEAGHG